MISLICTVKNEADNIEELIASMLSQSRPPDEIVINDCGSTDATAALVQAAIDAGAPIKLVSGGFNISSGRNNAIWHAQGPLIASTDAGLRLDREWLERITAPLLRNEADLVAGFYAADPRSVVEHAIGATNYPHVEEVDPAKHLAAGQSVAFRKAAWEAVGGYPEWLDHCEDLVFDQAVAAAGFRTTAALDAVVHFRPRSSLRALARQYYFYARGDGMAGLWPKRHAIRYGVYTVLISLIMASRRWPWLLLAALLGGAAYTRKPYRRLWRSSRELSPGQRLVALALPPLVRLVGDSAKMVGYPVGRARRPSRHRRLSGPSGAKPR